MENIGDMTKKERQVFIEGQNLAKSFCSAVNPMCYEKEFSQGFIDGFNRQHRTLQQKTGVVLYELLKSLAENYQKGQCDLRNQKLCEFAAKVIEQFPDEYFPFI